MLKVTLKTTDAQFRALHERIEKARKNSKEISVPRTELMNLLLDHSTLLGGVVNHPSVEFKVEDV